MAPGVALAIAADEWRQSRIEVLQYRSAGLEGIDWTTTTKLAVIRAGNAGTVTVRARKLTRFLRWRVEAVEEG